MATFEYFGGALTQSCFEYREYLVTMHSRQIGSQLGLPRFQLAVITSGTARYGANMTLVSALPGLCDTHRLALKIDFFAATCFKLNANGRLALWDKEKCVKRIQELYPTSRIPN